MTRKLTKALKEQKKQNVQTQLEIYGALGIPIGGQRLVEVPNRNSFVYVRLRDNQNEVVQAFNNKVAASYNLPVILRREGNRYIVLGVNTQRYQDNWNNFSPYLPKHGTAHSFSESGGGDVTWVYSRQMMPLLAYPPNSYSGTNVSISPHTLLSNSGVWKYVGGTGTIDLLRYIPTGSDSSVMILVYLDTNTGNPGLIVNSGSYPSNLLTGTGDLYPYIPTPTSLSTQIPLAAVRLSSGSSSVSWDNLYDVRQWLQSIPTGTGGGSSGLSTGSIFVQDDGIPLGTPNTLNFVGTPVSVTISGSVARIFVTGSSGAPSIPTYNQGAFVVNATEIDYTKNVNVTASGTRAVVDFPITTYFRVGQPNTLSSPTGLFWQVPDRVYASGSLGIFVQGHALIPGIDYLETLWVSGVYQYFVAQLTGSYHLAHYGVPCYPQAYISTGINMDNFLTDSNGELLTDSDSIQLTDSDG